MTNASKTVRRSTVTKMLGKCAPNSTARLAKHNRIFDLGGKTYHGPKGNTWRDFHVRKLVSQLEIDRDCAQKHFPNIPFR